ncbi:50S ribosomal protein L36 [Micromonospora craterilacus]|uniref:50S ribosomal protein L36 n=1 Tax=Micromonospora craterilacus TaxID=1655439 RepID=UPI003F6999E7
MHTRIPARSKGRQSPPSRSRWGQATTVDEAIGLLERLGSTARLVAGGHSPLPMMKLRLANFDYLIDINDLHGELGYIRPGRDHPRSVVLPPARLDLALGIPPPGSAFPPVYGTRQDPSRGDTDMKVRTSLRSLKQKPGSVVVRRRGRVVVVNRANPQWKSRQG